MGIFSAAGMFLLSSSDWCLSILYMQFIWTEEDCEEKLHFLLYYTGVNW